MHHMKANDIDPFDFYGLSITELTPESMRSSSVAQIEVPVEAIHPESRSTKSDKIYICIEGEIFFRFGIRQIVLKSGEVMIIERNEWFTYFNDSKKACKLMLIHTPPFDMQAEEFKP